MQFVENMLFIYYKYSRMVDEIFNGDHALASAMDRACAQVVNHRFNQKSPCRSPEHVSVVYSIFAYVEPMLPFVKLLFCFLAKYHGG